MVIIILSILVVGLIINGILVGAKYIEFDENIQDSFSYGIDNDCFRTEYHGKSIKLVQKM